MGFCPKTRGEVYSDRPEPRRRFAAKGKDQRIEEIKERQERKKPLEKN